MYWHFELGTRSKFERKNDSLALSVCFPQKCSSDGRMIATSRSRLHYYQRIVSFPQQRIRWNDLQTGFHWSVFVDPISLLTIVAEGGLSWAQQMWQQRQSMSVWCWFQDRADLRPFSPRPHPHRSPRSYFSISVQKNRSGPSKIYQALFLW